MQVVMMCLQRLSFVGAQRFVYFLKNICMCLSLKTFSKDDMIPCCVYVFFLSNCETCSSSRKASLFLNVIFYCKTPPLSN